MMMFIIIIMIIMIMIIMIIIIGQAGSCPGRDSRGPAPRPGDGPVSRRTGGGPAREGWGGAPIVADAARARAYHSVVGP